MRQREENACFEVWQSKSHRVCFEESHPTQCSLFIHNTPTRTHLTALLALFFLDATFSSLLRSAVVVLATYSPSTGAVHPARRQRSASARSV